jgi:hypothetical protein
MHGNGGQRAGHSGQQAVGGSKIQRVVVGVRVELQAIEK